MEELILLQRALSRDHLPLDARNGLDQRALQLAEYLRTAKDPTEEQAARTLGVDRSGTHYRKIRQRLRTALINGLTVANRGAGVEGQNGGQEGGTAWKYFYLSISPRLQEHPRLVEKYLREAIKLGEQSQLPQVVMLAARLLRRRSAEPAGSRAEYDEYTRQYRQARSRYLELAKIQDKLWDVKRIRLDEADNQRVVAFIDDALENLPAVSDPTLRQQLTYVDAYLRAVRHNARAAYARTLAITGGLSGPPDATGATTFDAYTDLLGQIVLAHLHLGNHDAVRSLVDDMRARMPANPVTNHHLRQLLIVNDFRSQRYAAARERIREIPDAELQALAARARERYDIFRGYLWLLEHRGLLPVSVQDGQAAFRLGKFLNTFTEAIRDKAHMNVHLIVIRLIAAQLAAAGEDTVSTEAIDRYVYRYLNDGHRQRSKLFLKALLERERKDGGSTATGDHFIRQLRELPVDTYRFPDTEIIPFEVLWDTVVNA